MRTNEQSFKPVIPYKLDMDPIKLETIKHKTTRNIAATLTQPARTEEVQTQIPILSLNASRAEFLHFVLRFRRAARVMGWTNGPTLFDKFELHLQGIDLEQWTVLLDGVAVRTQATFWETVDNLKRSYFSPDAYKKHKKFLQHIKKPRDMSPQKHYNTFRFHELILSELPGAPDDHTGFTQEERMDIFVESHPSTWQESFEGTAMKTSETDPQDIIDYFDRKFERESFHATNHNSQNPSANRRNANYNNRNSQNRFKPRENDPCPVEGHIGHKWSQCRARRAGIVDEYGHRTTNNNRRNNNDRNSSNNNRRNSNISNSSGNSDNNQSGSRYFTRSQARNQNADNHVQDTSALSPKTTIYTPPKETNERSNDDADQLISESDPFACENFENDPEFFLNVSSELTVPTVNTEPGLKNENVNFANLNAIDATKDLAPITILFAKQIGSIQGNFSLKTLFDSGSTFGAMINKRALPPNAQVQSLHSSQPLTVHTSQGNYEANSFVELSKIYLPEFSGTRFIGKLPALIFDAANVRYDLILGRNLMRTLEIVLDFAKLAVIWKDYGSIPFHPTSFFNQSDAAKIVTTYHPEAVQNAIDRNMLDVFSQDTKVKLKASDYKKTSLKELCARQDHLTPQQQQELYDVLIKYDNTLFSGKVGTYPHRKFHIDLEPDAKPFYLTRPYAIPSYNLDVVKEELDRQEKEGIITKCFEPTEWCMGFLCHPKSKWFYSNNP